MTLETEQKLHDFITALRADPNMVCCVAVSIFINVEGYNLENDIRLPEDLKRAGFSMRNLKGDFIK